MKMLLIRTFDQIYVHLRTLNFLKITNFCLLKFTRLWLCRKKTGIKSWLFRKDFF